MGCDSCVFISNGIAKQSFCRGENCIKKLLDMLRDWLFWCYNEKQLFRRLRTSTQQREQSLNITNVLCCICGKGVETPEKVIHHCHISGTIFEVAQSNCNLRARTKNFLPVFSHNSSRHDAHHLSKQLKLKTNEELSAIAKTVKTFNSFSIKLIKWAVGFLKSKAGISWICMNPFGSWTAINLFLNAYKILRNH